MHERIGAFAAAVLLFSACRFSPRESSLVMEGERLTALNREAVSAEITSDARTHYLFFGFTEAQAAAFASSAQRSYGAGLELTLSFTDEGDDAERAGTFAAGFLYARDISQEGEVTATILSNNIVIGDAAECKSTTLRLLLSAAHSDAAPLGFFVYGEAPLVVSGARLAEAAIGWDLRGTPLFAFGPTGGRVRWDFTSCDFSDARALFPDQNLPLRVMPKLEIALDPRAREDGAAGPQFVRLDIAGESLAIRLHSRAGGDATEDTLVVKTLQTAAFEGAVEEVRLTENAQCVRSLIMRPQDPSLAQDLDGKVLYPLKTDLGLIIDWPRSSWRCEDYEVFEWELFPGVLFFDFADYRTQNEMLTRLAYFVEKAGYKGTLVSDDFVENRHGYNAHDYKADDMAAFFTLAEETGFRLNARELRLREILLANGIIVPSGGGYAGGSGAIVSFSRESPRYLRYTFLAHESWHGIYFINEDFRNIVAACYSMFDAGSLQFIQTFWSTQPGLEYDTNDAYLMQNEFMAYLMQQSVSNCAAYFLQLANRGSVNVIQPDDARYIRDTGAKAFEDAARVLNDYALDMWGLACGRVSLVSRE